MTIDVIAFDADDTLWENEALYRQAQKELGEILAPWISREKLERLLFETEMQNLSIYGYGIKAFCLSMIETAIDLSDGQIQAPDIQKIIGLARAMLQAEVALHPHVLETLEKLSDDYRLVMITKGDLLDQTEKVRRSGLAHFFDIVEVVNHKTKEDYLRVFETHQISPKNLIMVGNSLRSDILPVLDLGGRGVYIPGKSTWAHEMVADSDINHAHFYELTHMGQLPDLISTLS